MYLFFDTETTGMVQRDLPADHAEQPRLVQLGAILADSDLDVRSEISLLIRSDGHAFDPEAVKVHGISSHDADEFGIPMDSALDLFRELCGRARTAVAHNIDFDLRVMATQYARRGDSSPLAALDHECTMSLATDRVQLESRRGIGFKPPTLNEAYRFFYGKEIENAHDAIADCRACLNVYRALREVSEEQQQSLF